MYNVDQTFNNSLPNCQMMLCCFLLYARRKYHVDILDSIIKVVYGLSFMVHERALKEYAHAFPIIILPNILTFKSTFRSMFEIPWRLVKSRNQWYLNVFFLLVIFIIDKHICVIIYLHPLSTILSYSFEYDCNSSLTLVRYFSAMLIPSYPIWITKEKKSLFN